MKKITILILSLIFLASCSGSHTTENSPSTPSRLTAMNSQKFTGENYSFRYASSATIETNKMGAAFIIYLPKNTVDPGFKSNVNLMIQQGKSGMRDLEEFKTLSESQLNTVFPDADLIESNIKKDSRGESYLFMHYTGTFGKNKLEWHQRTYYKNNNFYLLTLTEKEGSEAEKDDALLDGFDFVK